ncbi:aKG-HExxH-type peptide beta-hydroxylase [Nannocystis pusilla]|uniref:aKG-HExxH-type peptide beta-hydroxylase n=1 Tax=Nannocystis pusilla TaxID=889268 RepID=UPI003B77FE3A
MRAELDVGLALVVPVGHDRERHLSASYQEAIGTVYLSLHPSALTLAEALIHEFSHNKLHALLEQGPLLENAWSPLYASPVRPDPRPLHGVLLAAHAFLPVAAMLESMLSSGTAEVEGRLRQVARGNHEAVETLRQHARPTALGRRCWRSWCGSTIASAAFGRADRAGAARHDPRLRLQPVVRLLHDRAGAARASAVDGARAGVAAAGAGQGSTRCRSRAASRRSAPTCWRSCAPGGRSGSPTSKCSRTG